MLFRSTPPKQLALNEWPTLQEMINSNKRLVMFLGEYMFCTLNNHFSNSCQITMRIRPRFRISSMSSHTALRHPSLKQIQTFRSRTIPCTSLLIACTNSYRCSVDRPPNVSSAGRFSIINHVLDLALTPGKDGVVVPDILEAEKTNSVASIMAQVGLCQKAHGATPNFILLDYAERGN